MKYPDQGLFTHWMIVDFGISMFLITYASDMMSLWISSLSHSTTAAMTIMPFVLIFQLVFSGGMMSLPAWTHYITPFTISNPALKVMASQGDYNHRPVMTIWNQMNKMRDREVSATISLRQVLSILQSKDNETIARVRDTKVSRVFTLDEVRELLDKSASFQALREEHVLEDVTVRDILNILLEYEAFQEMRDVDFGLPGISLGKLLKDLMGAEQIQSLLDKKITQTTTVGQMLDAVNAGGLIEKYADVELGADITLGEVVDALAANPDIQAALDTSITPSSTIGGIIDLIGEDTVKDILQNKVSEASYDPMYENSKENILEYWLRLTLFVLAFAALSIITLEFIDKEKR